VSSDEDGVVAQPVKRARVKAKPVMAHDLFTIQTPVCEPHSDQTGPRRAL
jgi:hypothetical protein